jgi:predicted solute-binding protein
LNPLRLGCVKYLNARPLIHGWPGEVVFDHPTALCTQLARTDLDVALVSSFEFLRNPIYRIVNDVSISSGGPVYSVVVAYRGDIADVVEIELDPASQTSVNLLRCILAERKLKPKLSWLRRTADDGEIANSTARLLIGDQAIRFRRDRPDFEFWDLGEEWKRIVDLPFVFALWLAWPEFGDASNVADLLRALRNKNVANLDALIAQEKEFDPAFCRRYFREHLRFTFGEKEKEGLGAFHDLCRKHDLLPDRELELELV